MRVQVQRSCNNNCPQGGSREPGNKARMQVTLYMYIVEYMYTINRQLYIYIYIYNYIILLWHRVSCLATDSHDNSCVEHQATYSIVILCVEAEHLIVH